MLRYYVLATIAICLFLKGFFPLSNQSNWHKDTNAPITTTNRNITTYPTIEKSVLIIIDALRTDFIRPELMPKLASILQQPTSCYNHLKVEMPTVTLPRIKAITTGAIPQFIDIVLNLAQFEALEDSLIHQIYRKQKKIVFYGDDTWLKLFPNKYFLRSEGVSSFYVNDFVQVDLNVTRNINRELSNNDWDMMILHYLGLDHIGHVYGPKSDLIPTKLQEMDTVIDKIYQELMANQQQQSLIMVTGDHGMKDSGGHGGSTYHETNIPMILIGIDCKNDTFEQIDITPNLAILFGLEIPTTSIGQIRQRIYGNIKLEQYLEMLRSNTMRLRAKLDRCGDDFVTATHLHDLFVLNNRHEIGEQARILYENCSQSISEALIKTSTNQDINSLIISLLIICYVLLKFTIFSLYSKVEQNNIQDGIILTLSILQLLDFNKNLAILLIITTILIVARVLLQFINNFTLDYLKCIDLITWIFIIHPFTFFSSSFIEEEHQYWYFFLGTLIILQLFDDVRNNCHELRNCLLIIGIRFLRTMNQTGDQNASVPDLSDWLLQNNYYLQLLFIISLLLVYKCLIVSNQHNRWLFGLILVLIFVFRSIANDDVYMGKILWFLIFLNLLFSRNLLQSWLLIITLLLKPYNIILIPFTVFASFYLKTRRFNETGLILAHLCLANFLLFCQGNGNSLANIDISTGYIGLSYYQPIFVFLQVYSHTYAFPILINLLLLRHLKFKQIDQLLYVLFYQRIFIIFLVFIDAFIHRQHLFIWSVFAPKIIVETSHFVAILLQWSCYCIINQTIKLQC